VATLVSVNVGMPKDVQWHGKTVHTGIWKRRVTGARRVRRLNIDGDGQGDLAGHGGEQRAVLVYQLASYEHWQEHFGRDDFEYGQFGENFTVDGLADDEVCIGDRYRIGSAEFEVTQPRVTCFRVGMRLGEPALPSLLVGHHRPGFYLRVITEGHVQAGDAIVRTQRGPHSMSVAEIDALLYLPDRDVDRLRAAADIPALSPGWQESFDAMLAAAESGAPIDTPSVGTEPGWSGFRRLTVTDVVAESTVIASVYLAAEDGRPLPQPQPGQFLTLRVAGAADPAPVRSYSLSADPAAHGYRISVKREPHGLVSGYLHSTLAAGAVLDVAAPRGDFVLSDSTNPVLLISAGIGVTPVLAMLHRLAAQSSDRDVCWIHTAHDADVDAFAVEAERLVSSLPRARSHIYYTAATAPDAGASGFVAGRLTAATLSSLALPTDADAYICGPSGFMSDMREALVALGVDPKYVHTELFGTLPPINPGVTSVSLAPPHQPPGPPGPGPQITFARSGLAVPWSADYPSVLELAEACDVPTRWSCRTGVCHTCVTDVLSGEATYSTLPLEPPAPGQLLLCCAKPLDDLVLDL
jgi:ferredoxin-NADP reductase/MOSC domain-containing protein YiiM/ferredoxin